MDRIAALFSALLDATAAILEKAGFARYRREPYLIVLEGGRFRLYRVRSGAPQIKAEGDAAQIGDTLLPQLARSAPIEVRIDARDCVTRTLTLPRASWNFASSILKHQIERLTPWTLESVTYDWSPATGVGGEFDVRVVAAARARLQAEMDRLEQAGLRPGRVGISSDPIENPSPVDLLGRGRASASRKLRRMAAACLVILGMAAIASSVGSGLYAGRLSTKAVALQSHVAALRAEAAAAAIAARPRAPGVTGRKLAALPMVLSLERLSAAIPSDTWLTELRMEDDMLSVAGMSKEAASLVGVLEATDFLADVRLSSATASDPVSGKERFSIEARWEEAAR